MAAYPSAKIRAALAAADGAVVAKDKGKHFEEAVSLCLCSIAGIDVISTNVTDGANSMEIDIFLYNEKLPAGLQFLDHHIFVECKNWTAPMDSKAVRDFAAKIRSAHLTEGIIVAANGITGDPAERTSAHNVLRQHFVQDKLKIFVLTRAMLEGFANAQDARTFFRNTFGKILLQNPIF